MADYELMTDEELRARYPGAPADMNLREEAGKRKVDSPGRAILGTEGPGRQPKPPAEKLEEPPQPDSIFPSGATAQPSSPAEPQGDDFVVKPEWRSPAQSDSIFGGDEFERPGRKGTQPSSYFSTIPQLPASLVRVYDGDTFYVQTTINGKAGTYPVRIRGFDAPELTYEGGGNKERDALKAIISRGNITLKNVDQDKFGRLLADVSTNDIPDVAKYMTANGYGTGPEYSLRPNEARMLRNHLPAEALTQFNKLLWWHQRYGLRKVEPNNQFRQEWKEFFDKYVKPLRQKLAPPRPPGAPPAPSATPPASPSSGDQPQADQTPPFDWKETFANLDRPHGRAEHSSWEKSLWPEERKMWREFQVGEEYFRHYGGYAKENPQFAKERERFMHMRERFLDLTTKRWRKYKDRYQPRGHGGRRYGENAPQVQQSIAKEWRTVGMSNNGIAGMLQNVADESSFNPNLRHPDQPRWGGEAHYAHGLYQEGGAEWNRYANWIKQHHPQEDWRNPQLQSRFTALNLKANYPQVWHAMNEARSPEDAAVAFVRGYLKPAAGPMHNRTNQYRRGVGFRVAQGGDEDMQQALSAMS